MFDTDVTTIDNLETQLLAHERVIARLRAEQLDLIKRLDSAQVATADGCRTMAEWLASRLDVAPRRASSLVRTARRLDGHPETADRLRSGDCSFDRAEVTLQLAELDDRENAIGCSQGLDIQGVARMVAQRRRQTRSADATSFEERYLVLQPELDESLWHIWGQVPGEDGRVIEKALTDRGEAFPADQGSRAQRHVDALTSICLDSLERPLDAEGPSSAPVITLHVDATTLAASDGEAGIMISSGPRAGIGLLEQIICEGAVEVNLTTDGAAPLGVGRTTRVISPRLRRHVLQRDGGCTADGCTSRYRLQPHHVVPWSEGGRTDPDNLATLCWFHHHVVVHGRGSRIDPRSPRGRRRFLNAHSRRGPP